MSTELTCDECRQPYAPWFTDNAVWNYVVGGPAATDDPGGMLCPRCFTLRAESKYGFPPVWRVALDGDLTWEAAQ